MSLTNKEIYDLDNRNVASQNVKLGTLLDKIERKEIIEPLTEKQIYDLNNESVSFQEVQFGNILDALVLGEGGEIADLTDEQKESLTNTCVALQNVDFGEFIQEIIDEQKEPDVPFINIQIGDKIIMKGSYSATQINDTVTLE